ncbi:MAG: PKD domain-containing protein, partial [Planctomycetes bacterium]|nr:PKD domain-containing protein [Planctomycetota bacterium]
MQRSLLAIVALASAATAQFTVVIPNGTATTEGNSSNAFPWGRGTTGSLEIQTIYDSTDFTLQGVNFPIIIQGLRYRANGGATSAGGTYSSCTVDMATATVDALTPSTTFASNMGPDLTQVYSGPVTVLPVTASTPGIWAVDVPLTSNFLYDPTSGNDLVIFSHIPPPATSPITGNPGLQLDVQSTGALASRIYNSSTTVYPNTTGTIGTSHGVVVEVTYVPAQGLYAGFGSDVQGGASPLTVNFTDNSFSSDPAGVLGWAWDFDGDSVVDSTLQNPTFVYQNCGTYDVTLTVVDASHSPSTLTRTAYINTDAVAASFTYALIAPGVMQFTDTSVPTPTSWAWDFDGDNVIDDTTQNPAHFYAAACTGATVTLTANRLCGAPSTATQAIVISPSTLAAANAGGNGTTGASAGNIFDVQVINPDGVNICGVTCRPYNYAGPFTMDLYASDGSYLDLVGG